MRKEDAYWTKKTYLFRKDEYVCSSCGKTSDRAYAKCPHCGERMKKSKYDPVWVDEMEFFDAIF